MTDKTKNKINKKALEIAERNLISGNWTVETAQVFLTGCEQQPEHFMHLVN
jgi:hypothetical protein